MEFRSQFGAFLPYAPNSEHCSENRGEWKPWDGVQDLALGAMLGPNPDLKYGIKIPASHKTGYQTMENSMEIINFFLNLP